MRDREIRNALITSTFLGIEDHGIFTFSLHLNYGGGGQSFGQFCLDNPVKKNGKFLGRFGTAKGMDAIMKVLRVIGADSWEKLPKMYCRADGDMSQIYRIGHITENRWFDIKEHFKEDV